MVVEMKLLERCLTLYEEKYGVLSEDFYAALMSGKLARYDEFDETRADFMQLALGASHGARLTGRSLRVRPRSAMNCRGSAPRILERFKRLVALAHRSRESPPVSSRQNGLGEIIRQFMAIAARRRGGDEKISSTA